MMRIGVLACLIFLTACGDDRAENRTPTDPFAQRKPKALPPVPEGMLRVQAADLVPDDDRFDSEWRKENRWLFDWLELDGWGVFGWNIEASSGGRASIRWHDPRSSKNDFGTIFFDIAGGEPVLVIYGVRHAKPLAGPLYFKCPECGQGSGVTGSIFGDSMDCHRCGEKILFDSAWTNATTREFRVFVFGAGKSVRGSKDLKSRGAVQSSGPRPAMMMLVGEMPQRDMVHPTERLADPVAVMRRSQVDYAAGSHSISRRFRLGIGGGFSRTVSSGKNRVDFSFIGGDIVISGTKEGYQINVAGKSIELADYPNPVWDFELSWKPGR